MRRALLRLGSSVTDILRVAHEPSATGGKRYFPDAGPNGDCAEKSHSADGALMGPSLTPRRSTADRVVRLDQILPPKTQ
jgi:hypothetical protein